MSIYGGQKRPTTNGSTASRVKFSFKTSASTSATRNTKTTPLYSKSTRGANTLTQKMIRSGGAGHPPWHTSQARRQVLCNVHSNQHATFLLSLPTGQSCICNSKSTTSSPCYGPIVLTRKNKIRWPKILYDGPKVLIWRNTIRWPKSAPFPKSADSAKILYYVPKVLTQRNTIICSKSSHSPKSADSAKILYYVPKVRLSPHFLYHSCTTATNSDRDLREPKVALNQIKSESL